MILSDVVHSVRVFFAKPGEFFRYSCGSLWRVFQSLRLSAKPSVPLVEFSYVVVLEGALVTH